MVLRIGCARIAPTAFNGNRFIRIGSSKENLRRYPQREAALFGVISHGVPTLENQPAKRQDLSFGQLLMYYAAKGVKLNPETFEVNLGLRMSDGRYNMLAQLLSDDSGMPLRVAIFSGRDKASDLYSVREFGHQCLLYSLDEVLRYGDVLNIMQADEHDRVVERKDVPLFDEEAFREATVNSFVHNAWVDGNEPHGDCVLRSHRDTVARHPSPAPNHERVLRRRVNPCEQKAVRDLPAASHQREDGSRRAEDRRAMPGRSSFEFREASIVVTIPFTRVKRRPVKTRGTRFKRSLEMPGRNFASASWKP